MRISGTYTDRLLIELLPSAILGYLLASLTIKQQNEAELGVWVIIAFSIIVLIDVTDAHWKQLKTLEVTENQILLNTIITQVTDIISIQFKQARRVSGIDTVVFEVQQEGFLKEISVMDRKVSFLGFVNVRSSTLQQLYKYFPELKEKELKNTPNIC